MADVVGKAFNGLLYAGAAKDGSGKFNKELNSLEPTNKYDDIMDNDIKRVKHDFMGNTNAVINKDASSLIDKLYKEKIAYEDNDNNNDGEDDFNRYYSNKNYNHHDLKSNGFGDYLPYAVLGSAAVGLGAYQAYKTGNPYAPLETAFSGVRKGIEKGLLSGPKKLLKSNKTGKIFLEAVKGANKSLKGIEDTARKGSRYRFASEEIDAMFKEAWTKFDGKKDFAKTLIREDFMQNGVRALPYASVPIALSYAVDKNLKTDNSSVRHLNDDAITSGDRIVIDVPMQELNKRNRNKKASEYLDELVQQEKVAYDPMPWGEFMKHELPRQTVRAASWAVFPAAAIALTGRNIRGMGEKIDRDSKKKIGPVKPGMARVTIEAGPSSDNYDYKMASEIIDDLYKIAIDKSSDQEEAMLETLNEDRKEQLPFARKKITLKEKEKEDFLK